MSDVLGSQASLTISIRVDAIAGSGSRRLGPSAPWLLVASPDRRIAEAREIGAPDRAAIAIP